MNKKTFLKELEKKLNILEKQELEDIINEYNDIIDEKVRNGKSVNQAISDFGEIDQLASEILQAYKINPNYNKNESTKISDDIESVIKKGASKMAKFTTNVVNDIKRENNNITVEVIFEIIIKIVIVLLLCAIIKLPFWIIEELGISFLDAFFYPLNSVLIIFWKIIIWLIYIITCVLLGIAVMKKYFDLFNNDAQKRDTIKPKVENTKKTKVFKPENDNNNNSMHSNVLTMIIKAIMFLCFVLPFLLINIALGITIVCVTYLIIVGVNFTGLLIVLFGLTFLFSAIYNMFYAIITNRHKNHLPLYIIGAVLLMIGIPISIHTGSQIEYINDLPLNISPRETVTYKENITKKTTFENVGNNREVIIDNDLKDSEVIIEATHYSKITKIVPRKINQEIKYIKYDISNKNNKFNNDLNKIIINELKDNKVYDYRKLFSVDLKIYTNEHTRHLIKN